MGPLGFGDSNYTAYRDSAGNPIFAFDAADYLAFDRAGNNLHFNMGGVVRATITYDGWVRAQSGFSVGGALVWHAGNDGAGSGLDADLLGGKQSSAFALLDGTTTFSGSIRAQGVNAMLMRNINGNYPTVIHRTDGTTYYVLLSAPGTGFTDQWNDLRPFSINLATGRLGSNNGQDFAGGMAVTGSLTLNGAGVWTAANDGAGSGLDADLLDGQDSGYYTNIAARLGYNPVQQGTGIGQLGGNIIRIGWGGSRVKVTVDATDMGNMVFDGHIADVWRASNDGSGSGLDADLLDGNDGSYYANIPARLGYTPANRAGETFSGTVTFTNARFVQFGHANARRCPHRCRPAYPLRHHRVGRSEGGALHR